MGQEPDSAAALPDGHPAKEIYPQNVWPEAIPEIHPPTVHLFRRLEETAATLLEALAEYLGLPRRQFADIAVNGNSLLRILHYPAVPQGIPAGAVRVGLKK